MNTLVKITAGAIFLVLVTAIVAFIGGWWFMLTVGLAHTEWSDTIPTVGYWTAVKFAAMLGIGPGIHRLQIHYSRP
ncbi:hypothetical protein GCM10029992_37370 [Glycomyces albus]